MCGVTYHEKRNRIGFFSEHGEIHISHKKTAAAELFVRWAVERLDLGMSMTCT
jgi:hypothetical protein